MRDVSRDVSVAGIGLVTSLGNDVDQTWVRITNGESGAKTIESHSTEWLSTHFGAQVPQADFPGANPQERTHALARDVLRQAMVSAGLDRERMSESPSRMYVAIQHPDIYLPERIAHARAVTIDDGTRAQAILNRMITAGSSMPFFQSLSSEFGLDGIPVLVTTACASSATAIQLGMEALRRGDIERAVIVASDASITPEILLKFNLISALSTRNDDPAGASRPFSRDRDGFVMGEGAAALILEIRRDRVSSLGHIIGCGDATDNFHRTRSHPTGSAIISCMNAAIADAGLSADQIGYINAHGTSTPENDKMEAIGISAVFGARAPKVPVSSSKSMIGHTLAAAGAIEAVITLLSLERGFLHPTINHDVPDPSMSLDVIPNVGRPQQVAYAMSNSFGFGGQNASLILSASEERA